MIQFVFLKQIDSLTDENTLKWAGCSLISGDRHGNIKKRWDLSVLYTQPCIRKTY